MAKKKSASETEPSDRKRPARPQVELDEDVARLCDVVAGALGMSRPNYVNSRMRQTAKAELPEALKALGLGPEQE